MVGRGLRNVRGCFDKTSFDRLRTNGMEKKQVSGRKIKLGN
jgi:hypothetical protein